MKIANELPSVRSLRFGSGFSDSLFLFFSVNDVIVSDKGDCNNSS